MFVDRLDSSSSLIRKNEDKWETLRGVWARVVSFSFSFLPRVKGTFDLYVTGKLSVAVCEKAIHHFLFFLTRHFFLVARLQWCGTVVFVCRPFFFIVPATLASNFRGRLLLHARRAGRLLSLEKSQHQQRFPSENQFVRRRVDSFNRWVKRGQCRRCRQGSRSGASWLSSYQVDRLVSLNISFNCAYHGRCK